MEFPTILLTFPFNESQINCCYNHYIFYIMVQYSYIILQIIIIHPSPLAAGRERQMNIPERQGSRPILCYVAPTGLGCAPNQKSVINTQRGANMINY